MNPRCLAKRTESMSQGRFVREDAGFGPEHIKFQLHI